MNIIKKQLQLQVTAKELTNVLYYGLILVRNNNNNNNNNKNNNFILSPKIP